jgi:PKD repeat protein
MVLAHAAATFAPAPNCWLLGGTPTPSHDQRSASHLTESLMSRHAHHAALALLAVTLAACADAPTTSARQDQVAQELTRLGPSFSTSAAATYRIVGIGANFGNASASQICASGDLPCTYTQISEAAFNAMTVANLRAAYDVLLFTWVSNGILNADWNTRLVPYMALGGGIVFEDPGNLGDLAPGVTALNFDTSPPVISTLVPGLTDGITNAFDNNHIRFTAWDPALSSFLTHPSGPVVGLHGRFGTGCIVLTGPDQHFHGFRGGGVNQSNQYRLLLNEVKYVLGLAGTCRNSAPTSAPGGPYADDEGSTIAFDGSGSSDPDGDALTYNWDFGDGATGTGATPSHAYGDNGTYTVQLTVDDGQGGTHTSSTTATIANVAPNLGALTVPGAPIALAPGGNVVNLAATFTDPGFLDTHTGSLNCDGGSAGAVTASGGSASGACTFSAAGVYSVALTVTDDDGGSDTEAGAAYIVIYDPSAGFVTGGGWIMSPAGAYVDDGSLEGKATFGFVSKYQKGATTPTGHTQFQFHAGSFEFSSTAYDWLVIAGARAQYKGIGTIGGRAGTFGFLLTAIDGQVAGGGGTDKFRIKIWDQATGNVVYDNQLGQLEDSGAATALGGGSIVIHAK